MTAYPYINTTAKLREFVGKIPEMGVPESVTTKWLPTIGFGSVNHRRIIGIMKFIGFLEGNKPTKRWISFRDNTQSKSVMGEGIRQGYSDLFALYEDAYSRGDAELKNFFRGKMTGGDQVVASTVNTFKTLCAFAEFTKIVPSQNLAPVEGSKLSRENIVTQDKAKKIEHVVPLDISIQFHIDGSTSVEQIAAIFSGIGGNLLGRQQEEENE